LQAGASKVTNASPNNKLAVYEREWAERIEYFNQHRAEVTPPQLWDLFAPLWDCDGDVERIGEILDGGVTPALLLA